MFKTLITSAVICFVSLSAHGQEMAPLAHNGSQMLFARDNGRVEIRYSMPRRGLPVKDGTLLFEGHAANGVYAGTAYTFKAGCAPAPYPVSGREVRGQIFLTGPTPVRSRDGCAVIDQRPGGVHSRLVFAFEPD